MLHILAELAPLKVSDGSRPVLRVSSANDRRLNGVAGQRWFPAISKRPSLAMRLFDGDFSSDVDPQSRQRGLHRRPEIGQVGVEMRRGRYTRRRPAMNADEGAAVPRVHRNKSTKAET